MDLIILADLSPTCEIRMSHDPRAASNFNRPFDDHVGPDLNFRIDFRPGVNHSCRMNAHANLRDYEFSFLSSSSSPNCVSTLRPGIRYLSSVQAPRSIS